MMSAFALFRCIVAAAFVFAAMPAMCATRGDVGRASASYRGAVTASKESVGVATTAGGGRALSGRAVAARSVSTTSRVAAPAERTKAVTSRSASAPRATVAARAATVRISANNATASAESATNTVSVADLDELAQLTDFCKAQYMQCMDNFCNVLDDNQGRCSCSANLKNYEKTEAALKAAAEELQDVAQKIQYIGLSADEITTLFTQTEAELKMQNTTDNTQLKNDLDKIRKMIVDVQSGAVATTDSGISLDLSNLLDFTIDSSGFDLSALFGFGGNASSISNQRGEQLYKTAVARCKAAVVNSCAAQGVETSIITNAYDLEIDKQCIIYERSLSDANDQMTSTVRNAKSVLQKARLLVEQQKNQYDMRGCINALDACMQDEFVCGTDYEGCLDSTGKFIVNGEVVVGSKPGVPGGEYNDDGAPKTSGSLYDVWSYVVSSTNKTTSAWNKGDLASFIDYRFSTDVTGLTNFIDMASFLRKKIGYVDKNGRPQGMCAAVLNRCQNYTYSGTGNSKKFKSNNDVVRGYLERVLVQIKASQDKVLADYAESCVSDVLSCLSSNSTSYLWNGNSLTAGNNAPSGVAIQACMSIIETCQSVTQRSSDATGVYEWLDSAIGSSLNAQKEKCEKDGNAENIASSKTNWNVTTSTCNCKSGFTWDVATMSCKSTTASN